MSVRTRTTFLGYECDKCGARWDASGWRSSDEEKALAAAAGWACYVGRQQWHYCPRCSPGKPSGRYVQRPMRLVWGERGEADRG